MYKLRRQKEQEKTTSKDGNETQKKEEKVTPIKEETPEEKLKTIQDKLLRTMAEMENQRRRFEKEKQEAFEFGGFNFAAESLLLIDITLYMFTLRPLVQMKIQMSLIKSNQYLINLKMSIHLKENVTRFY